MLSSNSRVKVSTVEVLFEDVVPLAVQRFASRSSGDPAAPRAESLKRVEEVPRTKPRLS